MKSGIKHFVLKTEHSTRTLLMHSLITLFRLLFFSGTSQVVTHLWTCTTATGWAKNTVGNCVRRAYNALWDQLVEEQLPFPAEESW